MEATAEKQPEDQQPSLLKQLQERAQRQLEQKHLEYERQQQLQAEAKKREKKSFRNRFRLKRDSPEAKAKIAKLSRKEKKRIQQEQERLNKLSQRELHQHMMLQDPNNEFLRKLNLEGSEGLQQLQRRDIWASIAIKKELHNNDTNAFLNSLTQDEFTEFISERDIPIEKLTETGRASEFARESLKEKEIELKENHLKQLMTQSPVEEHDLEDHTNELKVFRDPTFSEFVEIVGKSYNPDLPLFAQLYICKEMLQFYQVS